MNKVTTALQINAITGNGETLTVLGSEMRNWCQKVGLLDVNQNFADKRSPEGIPTVRIIRNLLINF
jgi:hypothetical protein